MTQGEIIAGSSVHHPGSVVENVYSAASLHTYDPPQLTKQESSETSPRNSKKISAGEDPSSPFQRIRGMYSFVGSKSSDEPPPVMDARHQSAESSNKSIQNREFNDAACTLEIIDAEYNN